VACALALLLTGCGRSGVPDVQPQTVNSIETIVGDMRLPHEGRPHGVPRSFDWAAGPRMGMGNDPGAFKAMVAWGQLYEDARGNPATNTRVQIRDIKAYVLKGDGQWHLLQSARRVEGAAYREDFAGDVNRAADVRLEDDGSISVKAGDGYNYHFWPSTGRASIDPHDIDGVFTTVQARLVIHDPDGPDDRDQARYLLGMGGDYWLSLTAQWDQWKTNGDIAIGRFRYVRTAWQAFNMTTLSEEALCENPPPLE
jgi:hypothetical protein